MTGSNRGIGLELVRSYAEDEWRVFATCRSPGSATELGAIASRHANVEVLPLDVADADGIRDLGERLSGEAIDVLLNNAGVYGRKRLALGEVDETEWLSVLRVNAIAPFMVARAVLANLDRGERKLIVMLSSKVGSRTENTSGGIFAYRTSLAALNQVVKTLSIDLADRGIQTVALHPGWVQTEMGGPNALISTAESVRGLRRVIDELTPDQSGAFLAFDGRPLPW